MKYLRKLEDKILNGLLFLLPRNPEKDENSIVLRFTFGIFEGLMLAAAIGSTVSSVVQRRKARKSSEKMAQKARLQREKEAKDMEEAQKASRTPLAPRNQQLEVQASPTSAMKAKRGALGIKSSKRGKSKLRIGSGSGGTGARYA